MLHCMPLKTITYVYLCKTEHEITDKHLSTFEVHNLYFDLTRTVSEPKSYATV